MNVLERRFGVIDPPYGRSPCPLQQQIATNYLFSPHVSKFLRIPRKHTCYRGLLIHNCFRTKRWYVFSQSHSRHYRYPPFAPDRYSNPIKTLISIISTSSMSNCETGFVYILFGVSYYISFNISSSSGAMSFSQKNLINFP